MFLPSEVLRSSEAERRLFARTDGVVVDLEEASAEVTLFRRACHALRRALSALTATVVTERRGERSSVAHHDSVLSARDELSKIGTEASGHRPDEGEMPVEARSAAFVVHAPRGIHARPAARLAAAATRLRATAYLHKGNRTARCTSVTELMVLEVAEGDEAWLSARGPQASEAICVLREMILRGLEHERPGVVPAPARLAPSVVPSHRELVSGVCASPGAASGVVKHLTRSAPAQVRESGTPDEEGVRLLTALEQAQSELRAEQTTFEARGQHQKLEIFAAHLALLADGELSGLALAATKGGATAAAAWGRAIVRVARLDAHEDARRSQRIEDVHDVGARVLRWLVRTSREPRGYGPDTVLVAEAFLPSTVAHLHRGNVAALVSAQAGATSQAAIIARSSGIPYLAGIGCAALAELHEGATVLVDAEQGVVLTIAC
jgi:phosphotransferase system HPr (HPr) family protein